MACLRKGLCPCLRASSVTDSEMSSNSRRGVLDFVLEIRLESLAGAAVHTEERTA
jgi:hypothetical protein